MKVKQVAFYGEGLFAEGRAFADIGHSIETLVSNQQSADVHAVGRYKFVIACQVYGRHSIFVTIAASSSRIGADAERAAQQGARAADVAFVDQLAYLAAGHVMPAKHLFGENLSFKSALLS